MRRVTPKTIVQAVTKAERDTCLPGRFVAAHCRRGTNLHSRLVFVEWCEISQDRREAWHTGFCIRQYGSVRRAVMLGAYQP